LESLGKINTNIYSITDTENKKKWGIYLFLHLLGTSLLFLEFKEKLQQNLLSFALLH